MIDFAENNFDTFNAINSGELRNPISGWGFSIRYFYYTLTHIISNYNSNTNTHKKFTKRNNNSIINNIKIKPIIITTIIL